MAKPIFDEKTNTWNIRASVIDNYGFRHREYQSGFATAEMALNWEKSFKENNSLTSSVKLYDIFRNMMWEKEHKNKLKLKTLASYEQNIDYLKKDIPNIPINQLSPKHIEKALNKNLNYPRKCYWYKQLLTMVVNYAKENNYVTIDFNPFKGVTWVDYKAKETPFVYSEDLKSFLSFCKENSPQIYAPILLCSSFGLRPSEALCLKYSDISENYIYVYQTLESVKRKKNTVIHNIREDTKNGETNYYYISEELLKELTHYKNTKNINTDYICCNEDGNLLLLRNYETKLKDAVEGYNKTHDRKLPSLTPYSFRHSFGNIAKRNGENLYTIKDLMRHKSIRTTEKNYLRSDTQLNDAATKKMTETLLSTKQKKKTANILDLLD